MAVAVLAIWIVYSLPIIALLLGAIIVGISGIVAFFPRTNIEFDDNYMYILYQDSETAIELKKVSLVAITAFNVNSRNRWKIEYWLGGIQEIRFYPGYSNLDDFIGVVEKKNPEAKIIRSTGIF